MDLDSIFKFIIIIGIVQGFIFNLFVFSRRKKFDISIKYLNVVVLCLSLNNVREFVFDGDYLHETIIKIYLLFPWHLLVVPMFYVFLVYYLRIHDKLPSYLKTTYSLFVIESLIRIYFIVFSSNIEVFFAEYIIVEEMINAIYAIFIFFKIIKLIFFDKKTLKEIYRFNTILWIENILKLGFFLMLFWVFAVIYYSITRNAAVYDPLKILYSWLIYWLGYQSLIHSKILNDRIYLKGYIENSKGGFGKNRVENASLVKKSFNKKHRVDFKNIETYIIENQRYLDPLLSLEKLSDELDISVSQLSKLINIYSTYNFSDYINSLRVKQAKKLLSNNEFSDYTIVAIGLECGFNSKSTFYSAFKKFTSQTPTHFRG
jgi:AraC-like DNA-binding protein